MGRELKRVPLDFNWKIGKIWKGFINPHRIHECNLCDGTGHSKEYDELEKKWYSFENAIYQPNPFKQNGRYNIMAWSNNLDDDDVKALIEGNRLWDFTRVPINEEQKQIVKEKIENGGNSWLPFNNGYVPSAKEVNEWNLKSMVGHDSINCWIVIKAKLKRLGLSEDCPHCEGTGTDWQSKEAKDLHENWKDYEPPTGNGFQLWSTTTEGHPMTPVFSSLEDLCKHLESAKVSVFGSNTASYERWLEMLSEDFVRHETEIGVFI